MTNLAITLLAVWLVGCTTIEYPIGTPAQGEKQQYMKAMAWGQSRVRVTDTDTNKVKADICSDGFSEVVGGMWTNTVGKAASVFGAGPSKDAEIKDRTTCAVDPQPTSESGTTLNFKGVSIFEVEPPQ